MQVESGSLQQAGSSIAPSEAKPATQVEHTGQVSKVEGVGR